MNCKDVATFLDAYLAGELPLAKKWVFDAHIGLCKDCRNYIAGYREAVRLSKEAMKENALLSVPAELVEAILRASAS